MKTEDGYLAVPASGSGPGVLVLHAWWGMNEFFIELCDRLASEGFVALAPDLYAGAVATSVAEAEKLRDANDVAASVTQSKVLQALDSLKNLQHDPATQGHRVGVMGCSLGAFWALRLSTLCPEDIAATVIFYGLGAEDFTPSRAAYLGHFAENDLWEPLDQVRAMEADIRSAGKDVTFHVYPGAGHWFFEENREDAFHAEYAQLAWDRTVSFLRDRLAKYSGD
ncbi:MAG: dienelactone hydrolase family protein [Akkermansiaceae bacterium]|nr:dienelactone hydrolase family protein [Armatimonadota bacterium]